MRSMHFADPGPESGLSSRPLSAVGAPVALAAMLALAAPLGAVAAEKISAAPASVDRAKIQRDRIKVLLPRVMKDQMIDCWLTFTRENTTDPILKTLGVEHIVARGAFIFAFKGGGFRKIAIAASYDVEPIRSSGLYDEVIAYKSEGVKPHLKEVMDNLAPSTIAVNFSRDVTVADGLTVGLRNYLDEALGEQSKKLVSSETLVVSLLGRKLPEEIAALEAAAKGTQRVIAEALTSDHVKPGVTTEKALNEWMMARAKELGFGIAFTSITVGPTRGHSEPTDRVIKRGDVIRFDWGASFGGYCADIQRTAYVLKEGESDAPAWLKRLWDATLAANRAGVAKLVPGNTGNDVDRAARGSLVAAGYPEYPHGTGHAIGLEVHDVGPLLGPDWRERYGDTVFFKIEADQVFAVEPAIYIKPAEIEDEINTGLEEDLVVESGGARYIGTPQTTIVLVR